MVVVTRHHLISCCPGFCHSIKESVEGQQGHDQLAAMQVGAIHNHVCHRHKLLHDIHFAGLLLPLQLSRVVGNVVPDDKKQDTGMDTSTICSICRTLTEDFCCFESVGHTVC